MKKRTIVLAAAAMLAAVVPVAHGAANGTAEAKKLFDASLKAPAFATAAEKVDVAALKGKKVVIVELDLAIPIIKFWSDGQQKALKAYGVDVTSIDGKSNPAEWGKAVEQAIALKANAILLNGAPQALFAAQIKAANDAKIPVISTQSGYPGIALTPGITADVSLDYRVPARLIAQWFVADSKGKGNAIIFTSDAFPSSPIMYKAMTEEITRLCAKCKVTKKDAPTTDWFNGALTGLGKQLIAADPKITHFLPIYDGMTLALDPAVLESGKKVRTAGFNGTVAVMDNVKKGTPTKMDVAEGDDWYNMSVVDGAFRVLTGKAVPTDYKIGFRSFTDVSAKTQAYKTNTELFGFDAFTEFQKIWGPSA
jgi:ribose transport system substrate-binding protein